MFGLFALEIDDGQQWTEEKSQAIFDGQISMIGAVLSGTHSEGLIQIDSIGDAADAVVAQREGLVLVVRRPGGESFRIRASGLKRRRPNL